jgi:hypothetical protein
MVELRNELVFTTFYDITDVVGYTLNTASISS